jgi:hypothetical protein
MARRATRSLVVKRVTCWLASVFSFFLVCWPDGQANKRLNEVVGGISAVNR